MHEVIDDVVNLPSMCHFVPAVRLKRQPCRQPVGSSAVGCGACCGHFGPSQRSSNPSSPRTPPVCEECSAATSTPAATSPEPIKSIVDEVKAEIDEWKARNAERTSSPSRPSPQRQGSTTLSHKRPLSQKRPAVSSRLSTLADVQERTTKFSTREDGDAVTAMEAEFLAQKLNRSCFFFHLGSCAHNRLD